MNWDMVTNVILVAAIGILGVFAVLGAYEWWKRKSLKKVDAELTLMVPSLALMAAVYLVFDKVWVVSTRPDGSGEPSFPSSHAMVVGTVFALVAVALPRYVKNPKLRVILYIAMAIMTGLVAVGRVLANKHYVIDAVAGLIFAAIFGGLYYYLVKAARRKTKLKELAK